MDSKVTRLQVLAEQAASCTACELHKTRIKSVFHKGKPEAEICFMGEAPGADENVQGLPFVGRSGKLLDSMITAMGLSTEEVYICNIVKCRPPNNRKPELAEMNCCRPFLTQQLDIVRPRVIIALGATAVEGLLGPGEGITKRRGKWGQYQNIDVMPTFHPSYLLRTPAAKEVVRLDLREVLVKLGKITVEDNNESKT
jgi:DNA polymerase